MGSLNFGQLGFNSEWQHNNATSPNGSKVLCFRSQSGDDEYQDNLNVLVTKLFEGFAMN